MASLRMSLQKTVSHSISSHSLFLSLFHSFSLSLFFPLPLSRPTWLRTDLLCPPFHKPFLVLAATFLPTTEKAQISFTTWIRCQSRVRCIACEAVLKQSQSKKTQTDWRWCKGDKKSIHLGWAGVNSDCFCDSWADVSTRKAAAAHGTTPSSGSHLLLSFVPIIREA